MRKIKALSNNQKEFALYVVCSLILLGFHLRNIGLLTNPAIMYDEIGYWASAAYFRGYNWSGVIGNFASYYSYGYGFLLYLIMGLGHTPEMIHQLAIFINVLMVCVGFFITTKIVKVLFPTTAVSIRCMACFTAFFYPSVQYHAQVAWSETYLMFIFLCSIYTAIRLYQNCKMWDHMVFVMLLFNMYIIHMRSIGVVAVGIIYVLLVDLLNERRVRKWIISILILLLLLYGGTKLKNLLYSNVFTDTLSTPKWETNSMTNVNDIGGQLWKIKYLFTFEGIYNFTISFLGKIWYFGLASFFFGFDGFVEAASRIISKKTRQINFGIETAICLYVIGAYIMTAFIAAIAMITPGRWDGVAYGRYTDCFGIIIIAIGIIHACRVNRNRKKMLCYIILSLLFTVVFWDYAKRNTVSGFFASCSQIMLYFKKLDEEKFILIMALAMIAIGILLRIAIYLRGYWNFGIAIAAWIIVTNPSIQELIELERPYWIYPVIEYVEENHYQNIYYLYDENATFSENAYTGAIQYMLMEQSLYCIRDVEEIKSESPCIIVGWSIRIPEEYTIAYDFGFYKIIEKN